MTDDKKRPTRRNVRSELDDLREAAGDDDGMPDVTIRTWGVDLANDVDDVDHDDGVVVTPPEPCDVDACDEWALAGAVRCPAHFDGDSDAVTDE